MRAKTTEIFRFLKSHDFKRALLMASTMFISGLVLFQLEHTTYIIGLCIGILLTSICDSQGSFRHRTLAMALSIAMNVAIIILVNSINHSLGLLILFFALSVPAIAFLSVFGSRAGLFSFSGLLGIVLSLVRHYEGNELLQHALMFTLGGLIYICVSSVYHWLTRKSQINQQLGELAAQTARYLRTRLSISKGIIEEEEAHQSLLQQQVEIVEKQESLRSLILTDRSSSGKSSTRNRQMLILVELIDIMELAIANRSLFGFLQKDVEQKENYLPAFLTLSETIVNHLEQFSNVLLDNHKLQSVTALENNLQVANEQIDQYIQQIGLPQARAGAIALRNYHDYLEKQAKKIASLYRLLENIQRQKSISINLKQYRKFLSTEDYSPRILVENFTPKSLFFRHSIKLTIAMIIGYALGVLLDVSNPYWILLTVVVIMRPSYGLTKERSQKRVLGTVIGVIIATIIVLITTNEIVYIALGLISMVFAFSLMNRNYTAAATAITLNVVFVFSLLNPDQWEIIQFRLIDTVIGALVSMAVAYLVFPVWEYETIDKALHNVLESSKEFLAEIASLYLAPTSDHTNYRLSRKQAFLDTTELNASFQRFTQDPKSKQHHFSAYYELVLMNQSLLSTITNVGNYVQTHHRAGLENELQTMISSIQDRITDIQKLISAPETTLPSEQEQFQTAQNQIEEQWNKLETKRNSELAQGKFKIDDEFRLQLQEVRFLQKELDWMDELTQNMKDAVTKLH